MRTVRVPIYAAQTGFARRLASYFSFVASATVLGPPRLARPDLLFVESPPLFIGFAALALSRWWRIPYVFNVSDLWPESAVRMGVVAPGLATRLAERLELRLYRSAAAVTGQSSEIISSITGRVPDKPSLVVTNGVDPERFGPARVTARARELIGPEPGPVFTYAGLLGLAQGLDQILDLARTLPPGIPGRFVLVGDGPVRSRLAARIEQERLTRVRLVPAQPAGEIPALLAASDVALISLGMHLPGAVPSKIYEAMANSLPILLIADGEARERVEAAGAGLVYPRTTRRASWRASNGSRSMAHSGSSSAERADVPPRRATIGRGLPGN